MDRASTCCGFEDFCLRMRGWDWHIHVDLKLGNAPWSVFRHVFSDVYVESGEGDAFPFRDDSHDGGHAGAECGGYEIRRGKGLAEAVVIDWGVCPDGAAGWKVCGGAAELVLVVKGNFDHGGGCSSYGP